MFEDADVIHVYSRAQALCDGILIDAKTLATSQHPEGIVREAGFTIDIALTQEAANIVCPNPLEEDEMQSVDGRLWDLLYMARIFAAKKAQRDGVAFFPTVFQMKGRREAGYTNGQHEIRFKLALEYRAHDGKAVGTIMLPHES